MSEGNGQRWEDHSSTCLLHQPADRACHLTAQHVQPKQAHKSRVRLYSSPAAYWLPVLCSSLHKSWTQQRGGSWDLMEQQRQYNLAICTRLPIRNLRSIRAAVPNTTARTRSARAPGSQLCTRLRSGPRGGTAPACLHERLVQTCWLILVQAGDVCDREVNVQAGLERCFHPPAHVASRLENSSAPTGCMSCAAGMELAEGLHRRPAAAHVDLVGESAEAEHRRMSGSGT